MRKPPAWLTTVATFLLGLTATQLYVRIYPQFDLILVALATLSLVVVIFGLVHQATMSELLNNANAVIELVAESNRYRVWYESDEGRGLSYTTTESIVKNATESVVFVDYWEPFNEYQTQGITSKERADFYAALTEQVQRPAPGSKLEHKRVIQIAPEYWSGRDVVPFALDPPYRDYLREATKVQEQRSGGCIVRVAPMLVRKTFAIVDHRYVILPFLSHDQSQDRQTRYGALFIEDNEGKLVEHFEDTVRRIEGPAVPLASKHLDEDAPEVLDTPGRVAGLDPEAGEPAFPLTEGSLTEPDLETTESPDSGLIC